MKIDAGEVLRYIGADKKDEALRESVGQLITEISPQLHPRRVIAQFRIKRTDGGFLLEGTDVVFKGKLIEKMLSGASEVFLFAATLGLESELLLKRYFAIDNLSGVLCDGILTAAAESFCGDIVNELKAVAEKEGKRVRRRISCGYGDFDLKHQADFLRLLNAEKLLGVKLNENFMMFPNKTVTAIVAVEEAVK